MHQITLNKKTYRVGVDNLSITLTNMVSGYKIVYALVVNFTPDDLAYSINELRNNNKIFDANGYQGATSSSTSNKGVITETQYQTYKDMTYVTPFFFRGSTDGTFNELYDIPLEEAYEVLDDIPVRIYNGKNIFGITTWLKQWFYDKDEIDTEINDSGWQPLTYVSGYQNYDTTHPLEIRRVGKLVEIRGAFKPTAAKTASTSAVQFATIPSGYRPSTQYRSAMCQGGGVNRFMVTAGTDGSLAWQRYGTTSSINLPVTWLSVHITYMIN